MPAEHIDCCGRLTWEGISIWTWAGEGRDRPLHQAITLDLEDTSVLTSTLEDLVPDPVRLGPIGLTDGDLVPCPLAEGSSCHPRLRDGSDQLPRILASVFHYRLEADDASCDPRRQLLAPWCFEQDGDAIDHPPVVPPAPRLPAPQIPARLGPARIVP